MRMCASMSACILHLNHWIQCFMAAALLSVLNGFTSDCIHLSYEEYCAAISTHNGKYTENLMFALKTGVGSQYARGFHMMLDFFHSIVRSIYFSTTTYLIAMALIHCNWNPRLNFMTNLKSYTIFCINYYYYSCKWILFQHWISSKPIFFCCRLPNSKNLRNWVKQNAIYM